MFKKVIGNIKWWLRTAWWWIRDLPWGRVFWYGLSPILFPIICLGAIAISIYEAAIDAWGFYWGELAS